MKGSFFARAFTRKKVKAMNMDTNDEGLTIAEPHPTSIPAAQTVGPVEELDAVCVDYLDLGVQETPWGAKPQCRYIFETEAKNENGYPLLACRTFTQSLHELSAQRPFLNKWRGEKPEAEIKAHKPEKLVNRPCRISCVDTVSREGRTYLKLLDIAPPGGNKLEPSGCYRRCEPNQQNN